MRAPSWSAALALALLLACGVPAPAPSTTPPASAAPPSSTAASSAAVAAAPVDATLSRLRDEAARLAPLVHSALGRDFLAAVHVLPAVSTREVFQSPDKERWLSASAFQALPAAEREAWRRESGATELYYDTHYGSPLAYARALDVLGENGVARVDGAHVLDFGYGTVGHLRLLAAMGAHTIGVDVDPFLTALYDQPSDQGAFPPGAARAGSVKLVLGRWPAEPRVVAEVGGGHQVILAKNVLKRGYFHPTEPVGPRQKFDLGVTDDAFLTALHAALAPGGVVMIYNVSPRPARPGERYRPHADGRCPFSRSSLEAAGFEIVALDRDDGAAMRAHARALAWDTSMGMDLETDLFAMFTLLRRRS